ncbi:MAG TPA: class I adenylate-forming enzyme family protein, partial [Candidatus Brocadiales bacterium]|nr:class I adenylate-forming enzyme family protein [Candidatus Brocadiales bacterium]
AQQMSDGSSFNSSWENLAQFIDDGARQYGDKTFLICYDDDKNIREEFSYQRFNELVNQTANFMRNVLALKRGDKVATVMFNHFYTVFIYFACWKLGACVVPVDVDEKLDRKRYIIENSEAKAVLCWEDFLDEVKFIKQNLPALQYIVSVGSITPTLTLPPRGGGKGEGVLNYITEVERQSKTFIDDSYANLDDDALIVYTSGTTGPPKGVILSQYNLLADADGIADWHRFTENDRLMCILPIHHVNGTIVTLVTPYYFRGSVVLNRKFKSQTFWQKIANEKVTCVSVVPTILEFLLEANEDISKYSLSHFKWIICGAGPLLVDTAINFEKRFNIPIMHGYGLSETTCYSCFLPVDLPREEHTYWLSEFKFPSIGVPIRHNEMSIIDEHGKEVGELERGEIVIRGRNVVKGYFKRPDANEDAFKFGWFKSGDEGFYKLDAMGMKPPPQSSPSKGEGRVGVRKFFFITGRIKELIIRGGFNISPFEIDEALKSHPKVKFGMAIPFDNRYYGEEVAAYIVPKDGVGVSEDEILEYCQKKLDFRKQPKVIVFGVDVPYTSTGKPKRLELKKNLQNKLLEYRDVQFKKGL